ncbi:MetQ/NlpA family ABC transporter substrate-binding protein [Clostridium sp. UBA4548]|uniref:MetQ/NlpA family ABC transporter substrate-binding protein n=1 Tax=Clostridium sp. UBA4548 TaxID=1946361 RepID=UPI0025B85D0D|nr:MetQ/NlpA family ABC transporter substrate-binding protein [Clostridium sp. UBA4548]
MKKRTQKLLKIITLTMMVASLLVGCTAKKEEEKKVIKVGGTEVSKVTYDAVEKEYSKLGYKTEFVLFDSNVLSITAANDGQVDISMGQHKKFMETFNKGQNENLNMVEPYGYYTGIGLYSEKYKSVEEFPNGAKIAIMNDAMNMDIGMRVLQDAGLIELEKNHTGSYTITDVTKNPKNIQIIDMEQAQTVRSLQDMDGALVFFTHMFNAKKDPSKYLVRDKQSVDYPISPIVKAENKDKQWAIDFAKALKVKSVRDEIDAKFPGVFTHYEYNGK